MIDENTVCKGKSINQNYLVRALENVESKKKRLTWYQMLIVLTKTLLNGSGQVIRLPRKPICKNPFTGNKVGWSPK